METFRTLNHRNAKRIRRRELQTKFNLLLINDNRSLGNLLPNALESKDFSFKLSNNSSSFNNLIGNKVSKSEMLVS